MNTYRLAISKYKLTAKIPPGDPVWSRFNASFENKDVPTMDLMDYIYDGQAITTQHRNNWRTTENYICGQHIALDMDTEDERSTLAHLKKDPFIKKYASFIHTTISHKPEAPRARVVFLLDAPIMQAANYALAATALLWLFGAADRQCKDAARFFYGSPGCEMELICERLPIAKVKATIKEYQSTGMNERKRTVRDYKATTDQEEVAAALKLIPPWSIAYDEWVSVLMAIHSGFGDAGYAMAESWADGKPKEVEQKWRSFKDTGNTAGQVTVATVFGIAKQYGWRKALTP